MGLCASRQPTRNSPASLQYADMTGSLRAISRRSVDSRQFVSSPSPQDSVQDSFDLDQIQSLTVDNTEPFLPRLGPCKVVRVVDGDTVAVATIFAGRPCQFRIRLRGIDAPELRSKDPAERDAAIRARNFLSERCLDRIVTLHDIKNDKYGGRFLADVVCDGTALSTLMLECGLARAYDGGRKIPFGERHTDW